MASGTDSLAALPEARRVEFECRADTLQFKNPSVTRFRQLGLVPPPTDFPVQLRERG